MHINFTIFEQKLPENIAQLTIFRENWPFSVWIQVSSDPDSSKMIKLDRI